MNQKQNFPIFKHHPNLVYLDNAATSQRPQQVIDTLTNFQEKQNANTNRGLYTLAEQATDKFESARTLVSNFLNASPKEIVFTKNTTESLNLLAYTIKPLITEGKDEGREIVVTQMEHHSNFVPWQQLAKREGFKLKIIPIKSDFTLDLEKAKQIISSKTAILAFTHVSNVLGTINPAKELLSLAKEHGAITILDAAQSIAHKKIDVQDLDCDFMAFSSHKAFGPTGVGVLYGKKHLLEKLPPFNFGGGMIESVSKENTTFLNAPEKFEAGTQSVASIIAFAEAIKFMEGLGLENIEAHEKELTSYTIEKLKTIPGIQIYAPNNSAPIVSFNLKGVHPHDIASLLNDSSIAIRAGHHCCMPLMKALGINGTCRVSLSVFNSREDIDKLVSSLLKIQKLFNVSTLKELNIENASRFPR